MQSQCNNRLRFCFGEIKNDKNTVRGMEIVNCCCKIAREGGLMTETNVP